MSMKSESKSESFAYFSDGHIEKIIDFEISKDGHDIWFTVDSGRWFVFKEELVYKERTILGGGMSKCYYPEYKFFKVLINREPDEFGTTCDVEYLVTTELERIVINMS